MKKYIETKILEAREATRGDYKKYRGCKMPADGNPGDGGYFIRYSDGHESWMPKKRFEETYRECYDMTFGTALELLKKGYKVARSGWNGRGMFLLYIPSEKWGVIDKIALGIPEGNLLPWIGMKAADGKFVPWLASQTDMLAEDWVIIEESEGNKSEN